jgi:hypothetical protein
LFEGAGSETLLLINSAHSPAELGIGEFAQTLATGTAATVPGTELGQWLSSCRRSSHARVLDPAAPLSIGAMVGPEAFTEVRYLAHVQPLPFARSRRAVRPSHSKDQGLLVPGPAPLPMRGHGLDR